MSKPRTEHATASRQAPRCQECPDTFTDGSRRWRAYLTDDPQPLVVFYCPDCAEREFGDS
jgi:hypothetical protein